MNNGWVKAYRYLLNWQWHDDSDMMNLWMTLLLMANYEDSVKDGINVQRGQIKTSIKQLSIQTGITPKKIRGRIKGLTKGQYLVTETANDYTIITICNYDSYQGLDEDEGKQRANKGQTKGQTKGKQNKEEKNKEERTKEEINKEEIYKEEKKNIKESTLSCTKEKKFSLSQPQKESCESNVKSSAPPAPSTPNPTGDDVDVRRRNFAETIKPYVETYGRDMCNDFYAYWTEISTRGRKMRFEKESTWSLPRRLATWYSNDFGKKKDLPPEIQATLPSLFDDATPVDNSNAIEEMIKDLTSKYTIRGDDGEMYSSESDARYHDHPLSTVIEVETERIRKQLNQNTK